MQERLVTALATCHRAMGPRSKLLLAEEVIPPGDTPSYGKLRDLNMLVSLGGQERTEAEYRALYTAAGFTLTGVILTRSCVSIIEGTPCLGAAALPGSIAAVVEQCVTLAESQILNPAGELGLLVDKSAGRG